MYKFAHDTAIVGQISNNVKSEYKKGTECLVSWCKDNNLPHNVSKTKELIIDFGKKGGGHTPIYIKGAEVEMVESIEFLGVTINNTLSWTSHIEE
eukprot:g19248.t1